MSVISFSRNFGKEAGLYAGPGARHGAYVSLIDADLQQRPELVRQMVEILDTHPEYDIVAAYQDKRGRRKGAVLLQRRLLQPHQPSVHRKASSGRQRFPHLSPEGCRKHPVSAGIPPFSKGIFAWVGYETCFIPYTACERAAGTTKWSFKKLFRYAIDGIIGFSTAPLRAATYLGLMAAASSLIYLFDRHFAEADLGALPYRIRHHHCPDSPAGGLQLFCLGVIGEYIGKIFEQSKHRPVYLAKEVLLHTEDPQ